ncbi:hypothetical protein [Bacillus sp. PS06]|uniref:hypothetical protein n=1 Tax=Bacillus sp. PS06 TaxID=2764176 RepID=UPI0017821B71|nr:hypothetical protein [Bacillus sp. PS06]MBD8069287.1 hypothetical protein [Bacillus sp. PS06]
MQNILIGNGVTIQFGGKEYFNDRIIKRAINNINTKDFPSEIYPREVKDWLFYLHSIIPGVVNGQYDKYTNTLDMKKSLTFFIERYKGIANKAKVHQIGFEDYFLLNFLVCNKEKIVNPDRFNIKESLRLFFIDSIYNNSKIQEIHRNYPKDFIAFLKEFENLFTTNYDWNIEKATDRTVQYLHGSFHQLAEVYNPESFRNKLSDSPYKDTNINNKFIHLYSDALTTYSGNDKKFVLEQPIQANVALEKFNKGLKEKPEIWKEVNDWKSSDNKILRNLAESIQLKSNDESLSVLENRSLYDLSKVNGEISILGLSVFNDNHIFDAINNNIEISKVKYYYFSPIEMDAVMNTFNNKDIEFKDVKDFWKRFS